MRIGSPKNARRRRVLAGLLAISLTATACGGAKSSDKDGDGSTLEDKNLTAAAGESGLEEAGAPVRGGSVVYGVEADSPSYCLAEGQLAISGMLVVRAVYDTLTVPNAEGDYVPYLAKAITPNDAYDEWTIELRDGITFHNGTDLTAEVVKNNLDAYRGKYPGRSSLLFTFVLSNIDTIDVTGDLTLVVKTKVPWVAFPSYLYSSSRLGIMAQEQLDDENCAKNLIGTGPFKFEEWKENTSFKAVRNEDYWQIAPDGEPYPYLDAIEFRVSPDGQQRETALQAGDLDIIHTTNAQTMGRKWAGMRDKGEVTMFVSEEQAEVAFLQLNNTKPPFDDLRMRRAMAMAADRDQINQIMNDGLPTIANGPISSGTLGYTTDTGFPAYDKDAAKKLVDEYVKEGNKAEFVLTVTNDPDVKKLGQLVQTRAKDIGVNVKIQTRDQAALVTDAIARDYQAMTFRNYPGGDPDSLYVWFHSGNKEPADAPANPVNFAGINDTEVDRLLDEGRSETDPAKRKALYEELNNRMGEQVFDLWTWFTPWAVVAQPNIHGILGPALPGDDITKPVPAAGADDAHSPSLGLATAHSLIGLWKTN